VAKAVFTPVELEMPGPGLRRMAIHYGTSRILRKGSFLISPIIPPPETPILLGFVEGIIGAIEPTIFYGIGDDFHLLLVPNHVKPTIGGLLMGGLACGSPWEG
jgi:hypothetical protein